MRERPDLELWILVTTGRLGAQHRKHLNESAVGHGIALLTLAEGDFTVPFHPVAGLCAILPERTYEIIQDKSWQSARSGRKKKSSTPAMADIRLELESITSSPEFESFKAQLQTECRELPTWRMFIRGHHQRLKSRILHSSRAEFGTHFDRSEAISRSVKSSLDKWLTIAKSSIEPSVEILLGERFDGKTWAILDWLVDTLDALDVPVFFLSSNQGDNLNRLDEILRSEISHSLGRFRRHAEALLDRHRRWAAGRSPWCVVILDGLNEYKIPSMPWQRHLSDALARTEEDFRPCAILCTVRSKSWPDIEQEVRCLTEGRFQQVIVGSFDDFEFAEALRRASKTEEEIKALSKSAQVLIRRPRFFQLVLDHSDRLSSFETINEDVLYWLDISDKLRRNRPGTPVQWTEETYQGVLMELARRSVDRNELNKSDVFASLETQIRSELELAVKDLFSENVLNRRGNRYILCPEHLQTGMALYLLEILDQPAANQQELRELLRDTLSPYNTDDIASSWLRRASIFALVSERLSENAVDVLVDEWLRSRNRPPDDFQQIKVTAKLLLCPLLRLAPQTWTRATESRGLQEISLLIFSELIDSERTVIQEFLPIWCRFVPSRGPSFIEDKQDSAGKVEAAVGQKEMAQLDLKIRGDSGLFRLQTTALYLESLSPGLLEPDDLLAILAAHHIPLRHFSGFVPWIFSKSMAEVPRDWFAKWTDTAANDRSSLLAEIVRRLLLLTKRADLMDLVPLVEPSPTIEYSATSPSYFYLLTRDEYESIHLAPFNKEESPKRFLARTRHLVIDPDLPPPQGERLDNSLEAWHETFASARLQLERVVKSEDRLFRDTMPAIAAWSPEEGATVVLRQMNDLTKRFQEGKHWWVLSMRRHAVLAEGEVRDNLSAASTQPCANIDASIAPGLPLLILMPGMKSAEIVHAILHHCLDFEWSCLYELAGCLNTTGLQKECLAKLAQRADLCNRHRLYFLLSELGSCMLSEVQKQNLSRDLELDDNSDLHFGVLAVAVNNNIKSLSPESLLSIASGKGEDARTFSPFYASWLLVEYGRFLDELSPYWQAVSAVRYPARVNQVLREVEEALGFAGQDGDILSSTTYVLPSRSETKPTRAPLGLDKDDRTLYIGQSDPPLGGLEEGAHSAEIDELSNEDLRIKQHNNLVRRGLEALQRRREEHKATWSVDQFPQELIDQMDNSRFDQWIKILLQDKLQTWHQWMGLVIPIFCRSLKRAHPETTELWKLVSPFPHQRRPGGIQYLDRGIDWVLHELSKPCANDAMARNLLQRLIQDARTDYQLFEIALGARCQEQHRLTAILYELMKSNDAEERARATRLMGWIEGTEEKLRKLAGTDSSLWVRELAKSSLENRRREGFARHWLGTFLRQDLTRERRWGAGQLFLGAVDGSFEAWALQFVRDSGPDVRTSGEAFLLLEAARDEVKSGYSERLEKYFLEYEVSDLENSSHPWRRQRSWHELERIDYRHN